MITSRQAHALGFYRVPDGPREPVTKRPRVTKADMAWAIAAAADIAQLQLTRPLSDFIAEMRAKTGRPRKHQTDAAKQKAYRERKRAAR